MIAACLHEKYSFQKREETNNDGLGNVLTEWVEQFTQRGERTILRGGEDVMASRLEGVQPAIIKVRRNSCTDAICPDWRAVDCRTGQTYNIMSHEPGKSRQYYEMLVKSGGADG